MIYCSTPSGVTHNITPYNDHLQVRILDFQHSSVEDWKDSYVSYRLANVNGVPVLGYIFSHQNLNCITHINYPELLQWGQADWLEKESELKIALGLYDLPTGLILDMKFIILSPEHTVMIRELCMKTKDWPTEIIESMISFIYKLKFDEIFGTA